MTKRILMIEDTEDNRQILRDLFAATDYELIEAADGAEGLAMARAHKPDLILMDIQLPVLDGYETTRRIKADPELRGIPVIEDSRPTEVHRPARYTEYSSLNALVTNIDASTGLPAILQPSLLSHDLPGSPDHPFTRPSPHSSGATSSH